MRTLEVSSETFDESLEIKPTMTMVKGRGNAWMYRKSAKGRGNGRIVTFLRVSLEEAAAFFFDFDSRENLSLSGDKVRAVKEKRSDWEVVTKRTFRLESSIKHKSANHDREFTNVMRLVKLDEDTIVIHCKPQQSQSSRATMGSSRISMSRNHEVEERATFRFVRKGEKKTEVEFTTMISIGNLSRDMANKCLLKRLDYIMTTAHHFNDLLPSSEVTAEDGKAIGEALMLSTAEISKEKDHTVRSFVKSNRVLGELAKKFEFFEPMMVAVLENKLTSGSYIKAKVECLSKEEGSKVGRSLAISLATTLTAKAGVDEWILQFPSLQQVDKENKWFRPMLETIGLCLVGEVGWGKKMRVCVGAATSIADLGTDIFVCHMFWKERRMDYFEMTLGTILLSVSLQLAMVGGQNKKRGIKRMMLEILPVLVGLKPALDAYRVAGGTKEEVGGIINALNEMTGMKMCELFAEAIPGVIIQLLAILTASEVSMAAWLSLGASALSAGFISATISCELHGDITDSSLFSSSSPLSHPRIIISILDDYDTDPTHRQETPSFYGYIPASAKKRTVVFISMILVSAMLLIVRCLTIVLLGLGGGKTMAMGFIFADLGLFILVKVIRMDFWYWVPAGGVMEIVCSTLARVMVKIITDFTSIVHFRHPYEIGGLQWAFGLILTLAGLPVAVRIYGLKFGEDEVYGKVRNAALTMLPTAGILLAIFFCSVDPKYRQTFWSRMRGVDLTIKNFRLGDDAIKASFIFAMSRHHWQSIEEEVRCWIEANWTKWQDEKPKWLDEAMRARIPLDLIPSTAERAKEKLRRGNTVGEGAARSSYQVVPIGVNAEIWGVEAEQGNSIIDVNTIHKEIGDNVAARSSY